MHTITISEVDRGLKATIEPPVNLNPEAVSKYVEAGNMSGHFSGHGIFLHPMLVGSTTEATTIHTYLQDGPVQTTPEEQFGSRLSELLGFMGLETQVRIQD